MERTIKKIDVPVETKIFTLNYAKAEDLKGKLSEILTKGTGAIQVDERTNKIMITDLSEKMPEISAIIEEMDGKHKEVLIEAKIVQIELNDEFKYGVDWKVIFSRLGNEGIRVNFDNITNSVFTGAATGGALTIVDLTSTYFDAAMEVLQSVGKTNVISSPRITVLNNEEAKVLVGTNQPYVTTTTTVPEGGQSITAESITYIDVGVSLTVTPTINEDGYVTIKINPEISSLGTPLDTASGNTIPIVSTSESETTVMVKDRTTIVIAGLIEDRDEISEDKIPILGDIPLIGNFFKRKTGGSTTLPEKKELVIFLTPYIIHGTETFPEVENVWFGDKLIQRELLEQQMSLAVEDLGKGHSITGEVQPLALKKDTTT
ncbi:MAG: secretin N-terminal domain-containing protein, partial [Candidatus Omnitrophota bacterium]|nr:secretin N-terminal domain-containing protein [Candidatus Omnitrophota bacterium]